MVRTDRLALSAWKEPDGGTVGFAPGVFDLFHIGHLNLLQNASLHCDYLIAGVLTDELTEARKGLTPIVPFEERIAIVSAIKYVDWAEPEDLPNRIEMWDRLRFDSIIKGDDWKDTERGRKLEAELAPLGVDIVYVPYTRTTSSTELRSALDRAVEGVA